MTEECRKGGSRERGFHQEESGEEGEDQSTTRDVSVKEDTEEENRAGRTLSRQQKSDGTRRKSEKKQQRDAWSRTSLLMMGCCLFLYYRVSLALR